MTAFLVKLIVEILRVFVPAVVDASHPTAEDGARGTDKRDRLRRRIRGTWGTGAVILFCVIGGSTITGCLFTRTVYVSDGTPVRIRKTIKNAPVWVLDKAGKPIAGRVDIPEGWYALPMPDSNGVNTID